MKYIVVAEENIYSSIFEVLFYDSIQSGEIIFVSNYIFETKRMKNCLFKLLYKKKINKILNYRFEIFLKPKYTLDTLLSDDNEKYTVIFMNAALQKFYNERILQRIKSQYHVKFVLLFVDASFQPTAKAALAFSKNDLFDLIYTFDKTDAINNNFIYINTPYSKLPNVKSGNSVGCFFCGSDKGRFIFLESIAKRLCELDIRYEFIIHTMKVGQKNKYIKFIHANFKRYKDILEKTLNYNCILDVVQESESDSVGLSLRVYEALVYDKVLITNNKNILTFSYYNPQFMHYIEEPKEIKKEWFYDIARYDYKGEYSPKYFLKDISQRII